MPASQFSNGNFRVVTTSSTPVGVDREKGVIRGAAIMQLGQLRNNDSRKWEVDPTTLQQLVELASKQPNGVKARWTHPAGGKDAMGTHLGRYSNFRIEGDTVRADLHLAKAAMEREYGKYVIDFTEEDAELFGNSPATFLDQEAMKKTAKDGRYMVRLKSLAAIDVVDSPAATNGFFSTEPEHMEQPMPDSKPAVTHEQLEALQTKLTTDSSAKFNELTELVKGIPQQLDAASQNEQKRLAEVNAVFASANMTGEAAAFFSSTPGGTVDQARAVVLEKLLKQGGSATASTTPGSRDLPNATDPDANFRAEYQKEAAHFSSTGVTVEQYIRSRRIDEGIDTLTPGSAAKK